MFSRTWHGVVPIEYRDGFEQYAHFFLCTLWEDMESMMAYSGENPEIAVDYPEDEKYQLLSDPIVVIQEVVSDKNPFDSRIK